MSAVEAKWEEGGGEFPVGMKVLVVDDDMTCLTVLKRMLLECRYDVTTCSQAARALAMLRESRGRFDVIISDVHMPDIDGFRLLELVGLDMDLPVIMMSADSRTDIVMKGIKHGACDYLIKPVRMEELKNIWQHVVRKKWNDNNKEHEHSGSLDDSDRNRQATNDAEYASSVNEGVDGNWKSQKKKRDVKEEDDGELENSDPSTSKKPRVVWSVELHQQFVNAVNHLGIDKAVPKKILELMNVPGLTRENVASHLQKFRLYLKRIAQHHAGIAPFCGPASNAKVASLGALDFQALAASGQIPPQALAALQDELLGRTSSSLLVPARDQSSLQLASVKGNKNAHGEREIAFGQPILKCQNNSYRPFPQSISSTVGGMPSFPAWPSNKLGVADSTSTLGGLNNSQNSNMLLHVMQQQPDPVLSGTLHSIDVKPSGLLMPSQPLSSFQGSDSPALLNQNPLIIPSQPPSSFLAAIPPSINHESVLTTSQPPTGLLGGTDLVNQASTSQSLMGPLGGNVPARMNRNSNVIPSQGISSFQTGDSPFLVNQSSTVASSKTLATHKTHNSDGLRHDYGYTSGSTCVDSSLLSSQSKNAQFGLLQATDDGSASWPPLQNINGYASIPNVTSRLSSTSSNFLGSSVAHGKLPDQGRGRNLGFVGKGTCIPSRFAVDEIESPTNNLSHSIGSSADIVNPDVFGFSGPI